MSTTPTSEEIISTSIKDDGDKKTYKRMPSPLEDGRSQDQSRGVLSVQVSALPIVAGTRATVTLFIRNPFPEEVTIESIEAPSSEPLLPRTTHTVAESRSGIVDSHEDKSSFLKSFLSSLSKITITEMSVGPLIAQFPSARDREINVNLEPTSKLTVKGSFGPQHNVNINASAGAEIIYDTTEVEKIPEKREGTIIPAFQDDIASFELRTAHWLFVTPKVLELYAVIRYRLGKSQRSQVVPFSVSIRPPLTAIVCGSVIGGILGYLARQLTSPSPAFELVPTTISILGIFVMATILAIVLSRQDNAKGFVTLEDFYGAFVIGVLLGYTGSTYFESVLHGKGSLSKS